MKAMKIALAAAAATVALSGAAMADELKLAYNIGVTSDYVFRGVSQTQEDPAVQGGIDATYGLGYAGVWASNVDFGSKNPSTEVDFYAGVKPVVGDTNLDLGVIYYSYSKDKGLTPGAYSYVELKAAASRAIGPATAGVAVYYSPQFPGKTGDATYVEANLSVPVSPKMSLSGAVGHQSIQKAGDYTTWNVGVGYALTSKLSADLRYYDTDEHSFGSIYDRRVALTLKAAF
ncbi:TorF family putative porin [uncultured Caulobacter sp.]|uniref:TorF family putative porin n=1 Tax=uncultured Caulobacter sp. TaxID=158749 RepID=UPI0026256735|nr:TorF family putative porin [uncultured Caulobacter sp.]